MIIEPMRAEDISAVRALLSASKLPVEGLEAHVASALVAREEGAVFGSAALELYPPFALLRSVAVHESQRGKGLGQRLTSDAIALARRLGIRDIYLLTDTAAGFFPKLGFVSVPRTEVPADVQRSVEFTTLCPASAQAMTYRIG